MELLNDFFRDFSNLLWGWPMIILLLGTHLYLTIILRFPQRKIFTAIRLSVKKDPNAQGDVSQFGSLATALAATIGTGNIVGVATAIALGGPGAVLWCWLTGVFGISTKYAEGLLAIKYREVTPQGKMIGGPMYALEKGLRMRWLAVLFAVFTAFASFGIGSTVQANAISTLTSEVYTVSPYISGLVICLLTAAVVLGGVKSIARVCGMLVPFMALVYVLGCIYIIGVNAQYVWPAVKLIVEAAFTPEAAGGGFIGSTVMTAARFGIARGPSGFGVILRHLLGHRGHLRPHGYCHRQQRAGLSRHHFRERLHPHQGSFRQDSLCGHPTAHLRTGHLCLLYHSGLVLLWRTCRGIPEGLPLGHCLPHSLHRCRIHWQRHESSDGMESRRLHECPDGDT